MTVDMIVVAVIMVFLFVMSLITVMIQEKHQSRIEKVYELDHNYRMERIEFERLAKEIAEKEDNDRR